MTIKRVTCGLLLLVLLLMPHGAWAYHEDVHFNLTYVLCRIAELPANDALWIAAADQSMDDNNDTTAYTGNAYTTLRDVSWRYNGLMWHDFCDDGCRSDTKNTVLPSVISFAASGGGPGATPGDGGIKARAFIKARYISLWIRVERLPVGTDNKSRIMADIAMGQFLHFEQDYYSHRQFASDLYPYENAGDNQAFERGNNTFWPFGTKWGHGGFQDGTTADQVILRRYLAYDMITDCYDKLSDFAKGRSCIPAIETKADLQPLIDAIAASYGEPTTRSIIAGYESYKFPVQEVLNQNLTNCLLSDFSSSWPTSAKIPTYTGSTGKLNLPYDHPNEPLEPWIKNFKDASDAL